MQFFYFGNYLFYLIGPTRGRPYRNKRQLVKFLFNTTSFIILFYCLIFTTNCHCLHDTASVYRTKWWDFSPNWHPMHSLPLFSCIFSISFQLKNVENTVVAMVSLCPNESEFCKFQTQLKKYISNESKCKPLPNISSILVLMQEPVPWNQQTFYMISSIDYSIFHLFTQTKNRSTMKSTDFLKMAIAKSGCGIEIGKCDEV